MAKYPEKKQIRAYKKRQRRRNKNIRKSMLMWASTGNMEGMKLSEFNIKDIRLRAKNYRKKSKLPFNYRRR